jgi:hypothetical protein
LTSTDRRARVVYATPTDTNKEGKMEGPTATLEITPEDAAVLTYALASLLAAEEQGVEGWENRNDKSLDRLFAHFDAMARAGDLWRRVYRAMGVPQEVIAGFLSGANDEDEE